ncbi:hypothetical protein R3P38DRAFT_2758877 [Favolaschia claudopus]|uniref:Uncharacterized protein n=1 Tax=Favolaschia claudopus TaxID=2862362 RepID=A0AAW0BKQ7_9AGAR
MQGPHLNIGAVHGGIGGVGGAAVHAGGAGGQGLGPIFNIKSQSMTVSMASGVSTANFIGLRTTFVRSLTRLRAAFEDVEEARSLALNGGVFTETWLSTYVSQTVNKFNQVDQALIVYDTAIRQIRKEMQELVTGGIHSGHVRPLAMLTETSSAALVVSTVSSLLGGVLFEVARLLTSHGEDDMLSTRAAPPLELETTEILTNTLHFRRQELETALDGIQVAISVIEVEAMQSDLKLVRFMDAEYGSTTTEWFQHTFGPLHRSEVELYLCPYMEEIIDEMRGNIPPMELP